MATINMSGLITGGSIKELLDNAVQYDKKNKANSQQVLIHNIEAGIKGRKIDVLTQGTAKDSSQRQYTQNLIENAPELGQVLTQYEQSLPQGYSVSYGFDPVKNRLHIFTKLTQSGMAVGDKPLTIDIEDLVGNMGGQSAKGRQVLVVDHTSDGRTMAAPAGVVGLNKVVQALQSTATNYHKYLAAAASIERVNPSDTRAIQALLNKAARSAGHRMRMATQAARPGETIIGGAAHPFKTQNPSANLRTEQTLSYGHLLDEFFDMSWVKQRAKEAGQTVRELKNRMKVNMLAGASASHNIPKEIVNTPTFKQLAADMEAIAKAGVSIQELNDEAFGHGYALGVPTAGSRNYGYGRQKVQAENWANLTKGAREKRKNAGRGGMSKGQAEENARYLVALASAQALKEAGIKAATEEGGVYISESMAEEMAREVTIQNKESVEEIEKIRQKRLSGAQRRTSSLLKKVGGGADSITIPGGKTYNLTDAAQVRELAKYYSDNSAHFSSKKIENAQKLAAVLEEQGMLGDADEFAKEFVYARMTGQKMKLGRTDAGRTGFSFERNGNVAKGLYTYDRRFQNSDKLIGDRVRDAAEVVESVVLQNISTLFGAGVKVDAAKVMGGSVKPRKAADFVFGIADSMVNYLNDNSEGLFGSNPAFKKAMDAAMGKGALGKIYKFNKDTGRYEEDIQAFKQLQESGELEKYADTLLKFFQNVHKFSDKLFKGMSGDKIEETRNILAGFTGNVQKTKDGYEFSNMLSYSRVNPMSMTPYGMPENTEAQLDHRVQMAAENITRLAGVQNKVVQNAFSLTQEQIKLQEQQKKQMREAVNALGETNNLFGETRPSMGQYGERGGRVTVGYGAQYDINLAGRTFSPVQYDDFGNITKASFENSQIYYVMQELKKIASAKLGKAEADLTDEDLRLFRVFMDTNTDGVSGTFATKNYSTDLGDGRVISTSARAIPVFLSGMKDGKLTEADLAAWRLMNEVTEGAYLKNDATQTPELVDVTASNEAVNRAAMSYMAEMFNPVYNSKNAEYAKSHKVAAPNSFWGTNVAASFEEYKGKDLSTAYMSEEAARQMFKEGFSDKGGFERFTKFFEIATGEKGVFATLEEGIEQLVAYMKDPTKRGIIGAGVRYPASTGQDLRFLNWKIGEGLQGTGIKLSRGMSKLLNGDFDGDRILSMMLGFGPDTDMGALKKLYGKDYGKLTSITNRAAAALEQTMEADEAKGNGKTTLASDTLKSWSNESINEVNSILVGVLKNWTGSLSNSFQAWADFAHKSGLDEMAISNKATENERLMGAQGMLGRFLFSETTQQAISAKKISDQMKAMGEEKWKALSKEERASYVSDAVMAANDEVESLMEAMKNPLLYSDGEQGREVRNAFLKRLTDLGVADAETGQFAPRIREMMLSTLYGMAGPNAKSQIAFFEKLFPEYQGKLKAENLDKVDKDGNLIISTINRFVPTLEEVFNAFSRLNGVVSGGIAGVMEAGRLDAQAVDSENAVLKMNFMEGLAADFRKRFNWGNSNENAPGGVGFGGTINAQTVILNAKEVKGGSGGGRDTSALTAEGMKLNAFTPWGGYMNITNFAHSKVPHAYASGQNEQFWIDYEASGRSISKMREMERYQGPAGEALIEAGRGGVSAIELGNLVHGILEGRDKGDQAKIDEAFKNFDLSLGNLFSLEEIEKFHDEATKAADEIQAAYKRRNFKTTASEADIGFTDPETGLRVAGRGDIFGLREYTDHYGNKQMELNVGDYKKLNGGKIGHYYGYQLMAEQYALAQMMANWDKLGFNEKTTADDVNAIINKGTGDAAKILNQLGYRAAKGEEGKEGYVPARTMDTKLFDALKELYYFYGANADKAASHLTGTLFGHGPNGLMVREGINLFTAPQEVQKAFLSGDFENDAVKQWWDMVLNPRGVSGAGRRAAKQGTFQTITTTTGQTIEQRVSKEHGEETSLSHINQLLTQRLALEREIAKVMKERDHLQARVDAGDRDAQVGLDDANVRLQELNDEHSSTEGMINEEFNNLTQEAQFAFGANEVVRKAINEQKIKVAGTASDQGEQNKVAQDYERSMRERLAIESKLDQMIQRRNTTYSRLEINALDNAIDAQNQKLALVKAEGDQIVKNKNLRDADRKRIEAEYATERAAQKAQNAANMHGSRNIWDMMGYDIKRSFAMIFDFGLAHRGITAIQMKFRELIQTVQELDKAMTNIRIVTGMNNSEAQDLMKTYNGLAKELGVTTQAIAEASNEWLRQGYTAEETNDLIQGSVYLSTLGMIDASQATEYLTSMLKGFRLEASRVNEAVSMLVQLDMEYAASAGDIAEALSRTATTAQMAGMTLEETAAALTVIKDVSQKSASSIGESMKTLLSRYGNVKAGNFSTMMDTGEADESLNDTEKVLDAIGISIRSSSMEFRDFSDVLDDLADKWAGLSSVEKNAVATAMAGVRQRENFNILLENYDSYKEAVESASNAEGTAEDKFEAYSNSIEAALNRLKDAWDGLVQTIEANDTFKWIINRLADLVNILPIVLRYFVTLFTTMNAYKLPVWIKQIGSAINPFKTVAAGKYRGLAKGYTILGQQQRMQLRSAEYKESVSNPNYVPYISRSTTAITDAQNRTTVAVESLRNIWTNKMVGGAKRGVATGSSAAATAIIASSAGGSGSSPRGLENMPPALANYRNEMIEGWKLYRTKSLKSWVDKKRLDSQKSLGQMTLAQSERDKLVAERRAIGRGVDSAAKYFGYTTSADGTYTNTVHRPDGSVANLPISNQEILNQAKKRKAELDAQIASKNKEIQSLNGKARLFAQDPARLVLNERDQLRGRYRYDGEKYYRTKDAETGQKIWVNKETQQKASKEATNSLDISRQNRLANIKTRAIGGLTTGVSAGLMTAATTEGSGSDKAIAGVMTGGLSAVGTAIAGPLGGMIGQALGDFGGKLLLNYIHREEIARQERVDEAKERLEKLNEIQSSVNGVITAVENSEDWDADDYKQMQSYVNDLINALSEEDELRKDFLESLRELGEEFEDINLAGAMNKILYGTQEEKDTITRILQREQAKAVMEEKLAAQEGDRYSADEELKNRLHENSGRNAKEDNSSSTIAVDKNVNQYSNQYATWNEGYINSLIKEGAKQGLGIEYYSRYSDQNYHPGLRINAVGNTDEEKLQSLKDTRAYIQQMMADEEVSKWFYDAYGNEEQTYQIFTETLDAIEGQISAYEDYIEEMQAQNAALNQSEIEYAYWASDVSTWDATEIANATLEEAIQNFADELTLSGIAVRDYTGAVTEEARNMIESYLRQDEKYSALFESSNLTLNDMLNNSKKFGAFVEQTTGISASSDATTLNNAFDAVKEAFSTRDAEAMERYAKAYFNLNKEASDEEISEAISKLENLTYKIDPDNLENYAKALNKTVGEIREMADLLGFTTLMDLTASPDEIRNSFDDYLTIFEDFSEDATLSGENLELLMSKYPTLLNKYNKDGELISATMDNLYDNLNARLFGTDGKSSFSFLYANALWGDIKDSTQYYKDFISTISEEELSKLSDSEQKRIENAETMNEVMDIIQTRGLSDNLIEFLNGLNLGYETFIELGEKLSDFQQKYNEREIDSLQSQIDALENMNDERQKEIDLIKARDALENAKKEKKLVYRQGVGWTYESDQTAIQEAQDNLNDLDTDAQKEELQYRIDQLEKENALLEAASESVTFDGLQNLYSAYFGKDSEMNGNLDTIIRLVNGIVDKLDFTKPVENTGEQSVRDQTQAEADMISAKAEIDSLISQITEKGNSYDKYDENYFEDYNALIDQLNNAKDKYFSAKNTYTQNGGDISSVVDSSGNILDLSEFNPMGGEYAKDYQDVIFTLKEVDLKGNVGDEKNFILRENDYQGSEIQDAITAFKAKKEGIGAKKWNEVTNNWETLTPGYDLNNIPEGTIINFTDSHGSSGNDGFSKYARRAAGGRWEIVEALAKGAISTPKDALSLLNEPYAGGTEAIITPQGTITALPSKTGVVPAKLTKNLYNLAEVSPTLVKNLDSLVYSGQNVPTSGAYNDNSTNIQNLYATFQANEQFDFDELLTDIRGVININRH